ncbi:hypothetical protein DFH08DRAFT_885212 [Mycena albidolilacea]|uniref:Uncharacterized protein n=1 Tax=Mycena albidolilacea TaxID=1033008 RepID=A0AAD6ZJZ6_9AGAR|nr:hypothetical protein DFH08DRAFT_885212 [Mycena albidolilacea]
MNNFEFLSQLLSFAPVTLIPFIPNAALRYMTLGITLVTLVVYFLHRNTLGSRFGELQDSMREMEELFGTAADECNRDPYFLAETGLELATLRYRVSTIRTRSLSRKSVPWKKYLSYLRDIVRCIKDCHQDLKELRWSTSLALESSRQDKYLEDLRHRRTSLHRTFPSAAM